MLTVDDDVALDALVVLAPDEHGLGGYPTDGLQTVAQGSDLDLGQLVRVPGVGGDRGQQDVDDGTDNSESCFNPSWLL